MIEKKMAKLDKYFHEDIPVNIMLSAEKNMEKIEATIKVKGTIFRAESKGADILEAIDKVVAKLSSQMSKFKGKLQRKHKNSKEILFEHWPEEQAGHGVEIIREKRFKLSPMSVDEAVVQMEMLGHAFFVFIEQEGKDVCVVYKREGEAYGLLKTSY